MNKNKLNSIDKIYFFFKKEKMHIKTRAQIFKTLKTFRIDLLENKFKL